MTEVVIAVGTAVLLFAGAAVGVYFLARWAFMRAADQAARQVETILNGAARAAAAHAPSGFARYAAAAGTNEAHARREFSQTFERAARVMDALVKLPIVGPIGFDALLGLVPFVGDATSAAVSMTLVARSLKYGLPRELVSKMLANVLVDMLIGAVPLVGDLGDIWFRANVRNVALLREYLEKHP